MQEGMGDTKKRGARVFVVHLCVHACEQAHKDSETGAAHMRDRTGPLRVCYNFLLSGCVRCLGRDG